MNRKISTSIVKWITVLAGSVIGNELKIISPAIILLIILMIADYISGMLASKKEAVEHPRNSKYGWSSKKSIIGIYKKVGYILTILVAISTDYVIYTLLGKMGIEYQIKTVFGFLVTIWLNVNELLSILENAGRMGVQFPKFLMDILVEVKKGVDDYEHK